ncbi:hypothetical protein PHMEG_00027517 [Phytophthora megakarya]|uniref:Transmembrane protein n=1 Tax=Phytophthora megakarya TaxID=4795 RepID=A0A225V5G5_9STRA|nr:hypothetical protein PHMEG_00027517 [Phytophthora megakarya]
MGFNIRALIRFGFLTVLLLIATPELSTIYGELAFRDLLLFVVRILRRFEGFNMGKMFVYCGWRVPGFFIQQDLFLPVDAIMTHLISCQVLLYRTLKFKMHN